MQTVLQFSFASKIISFVVLTEPHQQETSLWESQVLLIDEDLKETIQIFVDTWMMSHTRSMLCVRMERTTSKVPRPPFLSSPILLLPDIRVLLTRNRLLLWTPFSTLTTPASSQERMETQDCQWGSDRSFMTHL